MKGKVFIAWSALNEDETCNDLAIAVKNKLKNYDYFGIVGGMTRGASGLHVGEAVLKELDQCDQALFLMQKKENGNISNNIMFELGYALSKFKTQKIHVFYIDITDNDNSIPSDIKGIWAEFVKSNKHPDMASYIVDKFLSNQNHIITKNKMDVIDEYHNYKNIILNYTEKTTLSEFELAQYILFFSQAAYMFKNEKEAKAALENFINKIENPDKKLNMAVSFALHYIDIFIQIKNNNNTLYLERKDFRNKKESLETIKKEVESWETDDFTQWFLMLLNDILNYTHILYASTPDMDKTKALSNLNNSIKYAYNCLELCDKLENNDHKNENELCVQLYKAYMYRNLYTAFSLIPGKEEESYTQLKLSFEARKILKEHFETHSIKAILSDNFEMEYYLALSEYLNYIEDEDERLDFKEDCADYIQKVKQQDLERNFFINKIEQFISDSDN